MAAEEDSQRSQRRQRLLLRVGAGIALCALGVWVTRAAWGDIFTIAWRDEEASHVWLVPVVLAWLAWARRDALRQLHFDSSLLGPLVIAVGWGIGWVGYHHAIQTFFHGGAVLVLAGCVLTVTGVDALRRFWPGFLALAFLIPVPAMARQRVAIPLEAWSAQGAQFVLHLAGIGVQRSGNVLHYHGVDVAVAEACNGMRLVVVLLMVCFAVAMARPLRGYVRAIILLISPLLAIVCNIIRLAPTVLLYGHYPKTIGPMFHELSGWAMVIVAFVLAMGVVRLLAWIELPVEREEELKELEGVRGS